MDLLAFSRVPALTAVCGGCHHPEGDAIPSLDGWTADELQARLMLYKSEVNGTGVMHRLMLGYSDEDIASISAYLAQAPSEGG